MLKYVFYKRIFAGLFNIHPKSGMVHKRSGYLFVGSLVVFISCWSLQAYAQNAGYKADTEILPANEDCSNTDIEFKETGSPLTKDERIARMDSAFFASLNKFDRCQTSTASNDSPSSSDGGASGASSSGSGGDDGSAGGIRGADETQDFKATSVASSSVSGSPPVSDNESQNSQIQNSEDAVAGYDKAQPPANGKAPEDIPAGDNDSILESQIRAAAMAETDPVKKALLWNEYRQYKGLKLAKIEEES